MDYAFIILPNTSRISPCKHLEKGQPLKAQYPMGNAMADSPGANILSGNSQVAPFQLAVGDITTNTASCYLDCLSYLLSFSFPSLFVLLYLLREILQQDKGFKTLN